MCPEVYLSDVANGGTNDCARRGFLIAIFAMIFCASVLFLVHWLAEQYTRTSQTY